MKKLYPLLGWLAAAGAGVVLLVWSFPRAFPYFPSDWQISRDEAVAIAEERLRDLGEPVEDPYVEVTFDTEGLAERRLGLAGVEAGDDLGSSRFGENLLVWRVSFYEGSSRPGEWTYRVRVSPHGEITALLKGVPPTAEAGGITPEAARSAADAFLGSEGFDLAAFEEPEIRTRQLQARTDRTLRYRDRARALGDDVPYGIAVTFAGDELTGFSVWLDDPEEEDFLDSLQVLLLLQPAWIFLPVLLLPVVGISFVRRYHAGEIGVRRGLQIFAIVFACGVLVVVLAARIFSSGWNLGVLTRQQVTWVVTFQFLALYYLPLAGVSFLCWSVGEVQCRERWPWRLAGFDALFKGSFANATVARDALRGTAAGVALAGGLMGAAALLQESGALVLTSSYLGNEWWQPTTWSGLTLLAVAIPATVFGELFGRLVLVSAAVRWLGTWVGGLVASVVAAFFFFPPVSPIPLAAGFPVWIAVAGVMTVLFLRCGLLTVLLASLTSSVLYSVYGFLAADNPWIQFQAVLPLVVVALPLAMSLRHLTSAKEFFYRYDDIPPHVRRIAERERQRVELETARGIQSSILPDLPPRLAGVELAHAYLPATEVGGDFYDVLALEDGRLAVAIGDVAGHGVSSGLVMSMAKSALAVQVAFNPEVDAVFKTLNRVVYQSARKRLLATLCYALLDPQRRELLYASAGHLYPYLVSADGRVHPLEYTAYPLGVRGSMDVDARLARLEAGDTIFLLSDGLVEAHPEGSEDLFGFERLEESLRRNRGRSVEGIRDGVLEDIALHTGGAPRDDDQTVVVLRVP